MYKSSQANPKLSLELSPALRSICSRSRARHSWHLISLSPKIMFEIHQLPSAPRVAFNSLSVHSVVLMLACESDVSEVAYRPPPSSPGPRLCLRLCFALSRAAARGAPVSLDEAL